MAKRALDLALAEKPAKKKAIQMTLFPSLVEWEMKEGSVLLGRFGGKQADEQITEKIACFDFDGTIACWKDQNSKQRQPKSGDDWSWFHNSVPQILLKLHSFGYSLVFLSNQKNITLDDKRNIARLSHFKGRIDMTAKELKKYCASHEIEVPFFHVLAATLDDVHRKPTTGMWSLFKKTFSSSTGKTPSICFYVGDAAGRREGGRLDHSDTDYKFALNLGIPFYVPEQVFNDVVLEMYKSGKNDIQFIDPPTPIPDLQFDPKLAFDKECQHEKLIQQLEQYDIILCIGSPSSGKSTFCRRFLKSYQIVNQDTLRKKCIKTYQEFLQNNQKVVIDNTNPSVEVRSSYISFAKERGKKVVGLWFTTPPELVSHNNIFRFLAHEMKRYTPEAELDFEPKHTPYVAFNVFNTRFEEPLEKEGFDRILKVDFVPSFQNEHDRKLWSQFLY